MLTDRQIAWVRKRLFISSAQSGMGSLNGLTMTQIGSTPARGAKLADSTAVEFMFGVPFDLNPDFPVGVRAIYACTGTTLTSVTWTALLATVLNGAAIGNSAAGALDTVIAAQANASGYAGKIQHSSRGIKNGGFLSRAQIFARAYFQISLAVTASGGTFDSSDAAILLGLSIDYMPMMTRYPHNDFDLGMDDSPL